MKIFIPSFNRAATIKTHLLLTGADYKVVLHSEDQKAEYIKHRPELEPYIVVSGVSGISNQRNWIIDNLMTEGEWSCMMDDNIKAFNKFPNDIYNNENLPYEASKRYAWEHTYCDIQTLITHFWETAAKADQIGAEYCGFASIDNAFFRKHKWKFASLVVAKMSLVRKGQLRYNPEIKCIDDYEFSIQNLIKNGKVLVNSYIRPVSTHNNPGGLGTLAERADKKKADVQYLMNKYPGLLRIKNRKNSVEGAEVCLKFYSENGINRWREEWKLLATR